MPFIARLVKDRFHVPYSLRQAMDVFRVPYSVRRAMHASCAIYFETG